MQQFTIKGNSAAHKRKRTERVPVLGFSSVAQCSSSLFHQNPSITEEQKYEGLGFKRAE